MLFGITWKSNGFGLVKFSEGEREDNLECYASHFAVYRINV